MKIRKAKKEDKEQILKLVKRFYSKSAPKMVRLWQKYYYKYKNSTFIFETNEKTVAYISFNINKNSLYVGDLYVLPKFRGKGIATKLVRAVEKMKKKLKKKYLRVDMRKKDRIAKKFYSKLGFKILGPKSKFKGSLKLRK